MPNDEEDWRADFEQAMGESFADYVSPPVPFADASAHECCEAVWAVIGRKVTPEILASLTGDRIVALSEGFGRYFASASPTVTQIEEAVAATLKRWPEGSLGE
ncbi:MAG: hypothetical protein P4L99_03075 [Chthoniobacter sp.]|nr:hypothetical protein [Chthoniobacter sp.]